MTNLYTILETYGPVAYDNLAFIIHIGYIPPSFMFCYCFSYAVCDLLWGDCNEL